MWGDRVQSKCSQKPWYPIPVNHACVTPADHYEAIDAAGQNTDSVQTNQVNRCVVADQPREAVQVSEQVSIGKSPSDRDDMFFHLEHTFMAHTPSDEGVSTTSPLMYVTVKLEGGKQLCHAMLDRGAMAAVAKASVIPPQLHEWLGKTRLHGAFGECEDAELSTLHVRLLVT